MDAFVNTFIFPAAFALLPPALDTLPARAELLAIGLQETNFAKRRQVTSNPKYSPARSFWQCELAGAVSNVLTHVKTKPLILPILQELRYPPAASACWEAIEHNDVLAVVFARLELYTCPLVNPDRSEPEKGWSVYELTWKPGKPHPDTWNAYFARAWRLVDPTR
jgi:hypothetical protein